MTALLPPCRAPAGSTPPVPWHAAVRKLTAPGRRRSDPLPSTVEGGTMHLNLPESATTRRPIPRGWAGPVLAAAVFAAVGQSVPAAAADAPGAPGGGSSWTTGAKQGLGTSATADSKVWFTLQQGVLGEVYYPRADTPDVQDLQLV